VIVTGGSLNRLEYINLVENVLFRLVSYEHFFELTSGKGGFFWSMMQNSVGESVCLSWCHVFGNRTDDLHFSSFFNEEATELCGEEFSLANVKSRLLSVIEMDEEQYREFWEDVKACRDQFIAHKEIRASINFPHTDFCRIQAEELRMIFAEFVSKAVENGLSPEWLRWQMYYQNEDNSNEALRTKCNNSFASCNPS
jgi:hypothetical protein